MYICRPESFGSKCSCKVAHIHVVQSILRRDTSGMEHAMRWTRGKSQACMRTILNIAGQCKHTLLNEGLQQPLKALAISRDTVTARIQK